MELSGLFCYFKRKPLKITSLAKFMNIRVRMPAANLIGGLAYSHF
jgi:hypothetical protein